jgi:NADPH:quinone reductase-like Zn-dependent oxidoreductase
MKAILRRRYGPADVLTCEETDPPSVGDADVLIKVRAASVNPRDWHFTTGEPYFIRIMTGLREPEDVRLGTDVAGQVEAIGRTVTRFKPGDDVFGWCKGAFAEYACAAEAGLTVKPRNVTFEQAASVATAGLTALQGLRDRGRIQPGQKVLINGAGGGIGTFAVQIARSFGADVTGVCSTRNLDVVRSIGAGHAIDYTKEDFTRSGRQYDLILDCAGNHSLFAVRRALTRDGTLVVVGGQSGQWMIGPMSRAITAPLLSRFVSQTLIMSLTRPSHEDLISISELLAARTVTPVIDKLYSLIEVKEAVRDVGQGHARGKVIIVVGDLSHGHDVPGLAS